MKKLKNITEQLESILKHKDIFTPNELVKLGLFGSRSSVHYAIHQGYLQAAYTTDRRLVIFKDSIINHIINRN